MMRRFIDLLLLAICSITLAIFVLVFPFIDPVRIFLGLPFVLFLPGYALVSALYPARDELKAIERITLSFVLSFAIVTLTGLVLNYLPWGVRPAPVVAVLSSLVLVAVGVAAFRRGRLAAAETFAVSFDLLPVNWRGPARAATLLPIVIAFALIGLSTVIYVSADTRRHHDRFTEFYILGPRAIIESYPRKATVGDAVTLTVGVTNREGEASNYHIEVKVEGEYAAGIDAIELGNKANWEGSVTVVAVRPGDSQKIDLVLYKGRGNEPYRALQLWLEATAPTEDAP